jgi:hypothetical protein
MIDMHEQIIEMPIRKGFHKQNPKKIIVHSMGEFVHDNRLGTFYAPEYLRFIGLSALQYIQRENKRRLHITRAVRGGVEVYNDMADRV